MSIREILYPDSAALDTAAHAAILDFTKPVQTRDGRVVRIFATDINHSTYPVIGAISEGGRETIGTWMRNGQACQGRASYARDLVQAPVVEERWHVIGLGTGSRADAVADAERCSNIRHRATVIRVVKCNGKVTQVEAVE